MGSSQNCCAVPSLVVPVHLLRMSMGRDIDCCIWVAESSAWTRNDLWCGELKVCPDTGTTIGLNTTRKWDSGGKVCPQPC